MVMKGSSSCWDEESRIEETLGKSKADAHLLLQKTNRENKENQGLLRHAKRVIWGA